MTAPPVYALEPFYGGSHKQFLDGLQSHLDRELLVLPMSPHHWKWRMHSSARYYADLFEERQVSPGIILASDYVHLSALRGLVPDPAKWHWLLYFHENQLTYPYRDHQERDLTYAHMNIQSALAADRVYFNSRFHLNEFLGAIPGFYSRFVDYKPQNIPDRIRKKSRVLPVGLDLQRFDEVNLPDDPDAGPGIILWNQRWEHDKNPDLFFRTLFQLADEKVLFQLIVCGERFPDYPEIFDTARDRLTNHIIHWGYVEDWEQYAALLHQADIVAATARHEFFGIAVLEALYCRCYPVLPDRLVYPEYVPSDRQAKNLYTSERDLYRKLKFALQRMPETREIHFRDIAARYDWSQQARRWATELSRVIGDGG